MSDKTIGPKLQRSRRVMCPVCDITFDVIVGPDVPDENAEELEVVKAKAELFFDGMVCPSCQSDVVVL